MSGGLDISKAVPGELNIGINLPPPKPTDVLLTAGCVVDGWEVRIHYNGAVDITGNLDDCARRFWDALAAVVQDRWPVAIQGTR